MSASEMIFAGEMRSVVIVSKKLLGEQLVLDLAVGQCLLQVSHTCVSDLGTKQ